MATQCRVQTVEFDPTVQQQQVTVYDGWGQVNNVVLLNNSSGMVDIYFGYVWDDAVVGQADPVDTQLNPTNLTVYCLDVDTPQPFDGSWSLLGMVRLSDGTAKHVWFATQ